MRIVITFPSKKGTSTAIPAMLQSIAKTSNIPKNRLEYDGYVGEMGPFKHRYCIRWKQIKDYGWEGLIDYGLLKTYLDRLDKK